MRQPRTSFDEFWSLYTAKTKPRRFVTRHELSQHPVVEMLCEYPIERLVESVPAEMRRTSVALGMQLQEWLRELKASDAAHEPTAPAVVRHRAAVWKEPHSLAYWNTSGRNGGLRRPK